MPTATIKTLFAHDRFRMTDTTQRARILEALMARGWELAAIDDGEWWVDEALTLRSTWSPPGARILVTFLVDPMHDGPRQKGENVWAVVASKETPPDREAAGRSGRLLSLGKGWEDRLSDFLDAVDQLR